MSYIFELNSSIRVDWYVIQNGLTKIGNIRPRIKTQIHSNRCRIKTQGITVNLNIGFNFITLLNTEYLISQSKNEKFSKIQHYLLDLNLNKIYRLLEIARDPYYSIHLRATRL